MRLDGTLRGRSHDYFAYAVGRVNDRVQRGRWPWSIRTAEVRDIRDVAEAFWRPNELGRFDATAVSSVDAAFVADPFVLWHQGSFHLFMEVWDRRVNRGIIGHATSDDGYQWTWGDVVLREDFHLSYPHVFVACGNVYMVPETLEVDAVRLYQADPFPDRWRLIGDLRIPCHHAKDASLVFHDGRWWCFIETNHLPQNDTLRLFSAPNINIATEWIEHPSSPILVDAVRARPAGPPVLIDGALHRLSQNSATRYGTGVRAHRIKRLTLLDYEEDCRGQILLHPSGRGWNRSGSHHVSATRRPGSETQLVAIDGY